MQATLPIYHSPREERRYTKAEIKESQSLPAALDNEWVPLESVDCIEVLIINNTGFEIQVRRSNSAKFITIGNTITYTFDALRNANELLWRRADYNGAKASVTMQFEVKS